MTDYERKKRPGAYHIVGSLRGSATILTPESGEGETSDEEILVTPGGVMYAVGPILSVETGSDGENILRFNKSTVTVSVIGEMLSIKNPVS